MTIVEQLEPRMRLKIDQIFSLFSFTAMSFKISIQDGIKLFYLHLIHPKKIPWKVATRFKNTRLC